MNLLSNARFIYFSHCTLLFIKNELETITYFLKIKKFWKSLESKIYSYFSRNVIFICLCLHMLVTFAKTFMVSKILRDFFFSLVHVKFFSNQKTQEMLVGNLYFNPLELVFYEGGKKLAENKFCLVVRLTMFS